MPVALVISLVFLVLGLWKGITHSDPWTPPYAAFAFLALGLITLGLGFAWEARP